MSIKYDGPVVLVIMDGVGLSEHTIGNAVQIANTPRLDRLMVDYPMAVLAASGEAVGLAKGEQGNSEVGHYTMGSGQIIKQGAVMVDEAIESGRVFGGTVWHDVIENVKNGDSKLNFVGIISDGNVHGHIRHLFLMMDQAKKEGVRKVRIHFLLDGRDTPPQSALVYVAQLEEYLAKAKEEGFDYRIASGGGRAYMTADRYGADWPMVERGWHTHVMGEGRQFATATEAIETYRAEEPDVQDQYMHEFVIVEDGQPVGRIEDGDSVIYLDFRADRAIEFSEAMTAGAEFDKFDRGHVPQVYYAGMVEYDQERHIPEHSLVEPVSVDNTLGEYLVKHGVRRFVTSETIKFGHVTFYFNGNKVGRFSDELEEYLEVPSPSSEAWKFPWMESTKLTDILVEKIKSGQFDSILINYPNGDIVGHEAVMDSSIVAVEAVDIALKRIIKAVDEVGGMAIITADHGNIEEEIYLNEDGTPALEDGQIVPETRHTTNPVPCIFYDNTENRDKYELEGGEFGLSNIAATVALLLGLEPAEGWKEPIIRIKE